MIGNLGRYERTANLYDGQYEPQYYNDNGELTSDPLACHSTTYIPITSTRTFTISNTWYSAQYQAAFAVYEWDTNKNWIRRSNRQNPTSTKTITFTVGNDCVYFTLQIQKDTPNIMLNKGATALPYEPYGNTWHDIPYTKLETATDTLSALPVTTYNDGTSATVAIKGNMQQSGTPTPSSPITPSECGERTSNLLDFRTWCNSIASINGNGTFTTDAHSISITSGTSTDAYTSPFGASNPNTYRMEVKPNTAYSIYIFFRSGQ